LKTVRGAHATIQPAMQANPYEAPRARVDDDAEDILLAPGDAAAKREALLGREAALRTAGWLLMPLGATLFVFGFVFSGGGFQYPDGSLKTELAMIVARLLFLGTTGLFLGWGMTELSPWVKPAIAVLAAPVLVLATPLLPFTGYCTWLALSAKGRCVLSREHVQWRELTPGLRARSQPGEALVVVGILVLNLAAVGWIAGRMA